MKSLSAGLAFFNFSTISALLLGLIVGGLSRPVAWAAIIICLVFALLAYFFTTDVPLRSRPDKLTAPTPANPLNRQQMRESRGSQPHVYLHPKHSYLSI